MRCFTTGAVMFLALTAAGCGTGELGPAKPEETPVVTPEQVQEAYTKGMPPEAKKMYDKMKKGGS
jgi:hypothetical protein